MGFPLLAEGQTGIFYLYNLVLFHLFNVVTAFNLSYLLIFLTCFIGSFLFAKSLKLKTVSSFYLAFLFTFSGVMITQVPHINLIQVVCFLPWQFYFSEKFLQTNKKIWLLGTIFVTTQQFFATYQQIVLITFIGLGIYTTIRSWQENKLGHLIPFALAILLGTTLSMPQLLPSLQMVKLSNRPSGLPAADLVAFPYHPKNLLSFLNPYFWGDPRKGTYPAYSADWGIFWEQTGYIGILPLSLAVLAFWDRKSREVVKIFGIILVISLILLLGKYTPFFFVFQLPPLDLFRVPARFLILFVWALTILAAIGFNKIKSQALTYIIIAFSFIS